MYKVLTFGKVSYRPPLDKVETALGKLQNSVPIAEYDLLVPRASVKDADEWMLDFIAER